MIGRVVLIVVLIGVVPVVVAATVVGWTVPTVLVTLTGIVASVATAYLTAFRPPIIRLIPSPPSPQEDRVVSYSAGVPDGWSIVFKLIVVNEGARPGVLSGFSVDLPCVRHSPRVPRSFKVRFSGLEWDKAAGYRSSTPWYPVPLPLVLPPMAREKVWFRAMLELSTRVPEELAADLRGLVGLQVKLAYVAGSERKPRKRGMTVALNYDGLKAGLASYWAGTNAWRPLGEVIRGRSDSTPGSDA